MRQFLIKLLSPKPTEEQRIAKAVEAALKKNKGSGDPLDITSRSRWNSTEERPNPIQLNVSHFPLAERMPSIATDGKFRLAIADAAEDDDADTPMSLKGRASAYTVPEQLQNWYMSQSFIGYQACAIIAQHWLIDKACSMAGEDAARNGWEVKALGEDESMSKDQLDQLRSFDKKFKVKQNLVALERFKNIFGIRIAIFHVDSDDEDYYEKPFNIDGVTRDSYRGISQIDPYWMMPMLTAESTADPSNIHFYDPEFWVISGKKYHRSHLIISRGPEPTDILKPTYIFGGISMVQRIYERVYAAERTANEAPLLSLSKRTTALHVDVEKALLNEKSFTQKLLLWVKYRDNHAVKVLGKDEKMEQFDTNLSDFDSIIMNQYQLVAAIAEVPATKILGTSPKGFNATGEFETVSYHEKLESIQEHGMCPMLQRHYDILGRSLGINAEVEIVFNDVDSLTSTQQADVNLKKSQKAEIDINSGAIAPDEWRSALRDDKHAGYTRLNDDAAETPPGMSPESLADLEKAGAAAQNAASPAPGATAQEEAVLPAVPAPRRAENTPIENPSTVAPVVAPEVEESNGAIMSVLRQLSTRLGQIEEALIPEGQDLPKGSSFAGVRTAAPSLTGLQPGVAGIGSAVGNIEQHRQPKLKIGGILTSIENPRGTTRRGTTLDGEEWQSTMPHHYGYIRGVTGADGDELDCFIGPNLASAMVYVINQNEPTTGEFDEHKVMLGFDSPEAAQEAYQSSYQDGWTGFGSIIPMELEDFKHRLKDFFWNVPAEPYYIPKHKMDK